MTPKKVPVGGSSAVTLILYSPVCPVENGLPSLPWTLTVPVNVSVTFFDGSTMPVHAIVNRPARVSASACSATGPATS